jgi:hypothetical protein
MKLLLLALFSVVAFAQAKSAILTWTDAINPAGTTYNVYRAPGPCVSTPAPVFAKIASAVPAKTYTDPALALGTYCYRVTAFGGGLESDPSTAVGAAVPPATPGGLSITVTVTVTVQ